MSAFASRSLHLLVYAAAGLLALAIGRGGLWIAAPFALVFAVLPLLDAALGLDTTPPARAKRPLLLDAPLLLWIPTQIALTLAALSAVASGERSGWEAAGVVAGLGLINGSGGINVAHELMHRPGRRHRALAELLMAWVGYPHFCIEHVHGHHRRAATPADPASARLGESLPAFLARVLPGSLASAWRLESARVARAGGAWGPGDARLRQPLLVAALAGGAAAAFGTAGLAAFLLQGAYAVLLLETINYVEHYGLCRRERAPGRYERVGPEHSWNSAHRVSNGYLFNLARHSDHHAEASRPWHQLRHQPDAPQLPAGYATMLLAAWVPPLWFRVMDPRVHEWRRTQAEAVPSADG